MSLKKVIPLFTSASVVWVWVWLERLHTFRFLIEIAHSRAAAVAWQIAQSRATHTLLLMVILAACTACWLKLLALSRSSHGTRRKRQGRQGSEIKTGKAMSAGSRSAV